MHAYNSEFLQTMELNIHFGPKTEENANFRLMELPKELVEVVQSGTLNQLSRNSAKDTIRLGVTR